MFCPECGTKNENDARFCFKCGNKLSSDKHNKLSHLSKKSKILMLFSSVVVIVALVFLAFLLRNPVKMIEDSLAKYYDNYNAYNNKELVNIGRVLKSNKENDKVLGAIKNTTQKIINSWVKNFNTAYKDKEALDEAYDRATGALGDIYEYYNGLEFMLDKELYEKLKEEVKVLYDSKVSYLNGLEAMGDDDSYKAYYYYQRVEMSDSYYHEVQDFLEEYVKDAVVSVKEKALEYVSGIDKASNEEKLEAYVKELDYLDDNKITQNVDVSITEEYKNLRNETLEMIVKITKEIVQKLDGEGDVKDILEVIDKSLKYLDEDDKYYKELEELRDKYEDKIPDNLVDKHRVAYSGSKHSSIKRTINDEDYDSYISFSFKGMTGNAVYRLNKEYKRLETKIVLADNLTDDLVGEFVIYGDDKEIYRSGEVKKGIDLRSIIDIDITGVMDLKIEFVTTSKGSGWMDYNIYLVEPCLYR